MVVCRSATESADSLLQIESRSASSTTPGKIAIAVRKSVLVGIWFSAGRIYHRLSRLIDRKVCLSADITQEAEAIASASDSAKLYVRFGSDSCQLFAVVD